MTMPLCCNLVLGEIRIVAVMHMYVDGSYFECQGPIKVAGNG